MISPGNDMPTRPRLVAGARVERSKCVGPHDVVTFDVSGVTVSFQAVDVDSKMRPSLSLRVPSGVDVALESTTVLVSRPGASEQTRRIPRVRVYRTRDGRDEIIDLPPTERIAGATLPMRHAPSKTYHRGVYVDVDTPLDVPDAPGTTLSVRYPRLVINGRPVDMPALSVRRARWQTAFMPLNC